MNHKCYRIEITNRRNLKTLAGGLPAFGDCDTFDTIREAARAIYEGAYDIIDRMISEAPDMPTNDDAWFDEHARRLDAELEDIVKYEGWAHDGVQYSIVETDNHAITEEA